MSAKTTLERLLAGTDVVFNGPHPWDPQIRDERAYRRFLLEGSVGAGDSYMDGWWDAEAPDELICRLLRERSHGKLLSLPLLFYAALAFVFNLQSRSRAFEVGKRHYDVGNDLYKAMLDRRMTYTCGYWSSPSGEAKTLDEAQEAKLDLVCRKIGLKKGDRVLDIGGGWGSFARFAAERYGASVVAITISKEQAALGRELCSSLPVDIRLQDYRDLHDETFDHVVSLGMFEHVGVKNYRTYMHVVRRVLKPDGLFLLHTIGSNKSLWFADPWIAKRIFPNGMLPSIAQIGKAVEGLFIMEDWHNFGTDYDTTLMAWFSNFDTAWPLLKEKYGERFYRMWKFYLLSCAGGFRARNTQLWQIVLSPRGVPGGYRSIR